LDEERLGESRQLELAHAAVELGEHGFQQRVFFGIGARLLCGARGREHCGEQRPIARKPNPSRIPVALIESRIHLESRLIAPPSP
jgi:hypothetical protein